MLRRLVNGYDMAYIEVGEGPLLICVHSTLGDFRVPVLGALHSDTVSLRRACGIFF